MEFEIDGMKFAAVGTVTPAQNTRSFAAIRDFACGLGRSRKRLNLLKKILASTLGAFQKLSRHARLAEITGRGGSMGRSSSSSLIMVRSALILIAVSFIAALTGCSSSSPTTNTVFPVPANIILAPANTISLDVGSANQTFTATPQNSKHVAITTPVSFLSSNTAVLTIASNGLACAGTWDSLTAPQICTPGPVGVVQVTATSHGVSSPPTTVYVHQHIDSIVLSAIPDQNPPAGPCLSKGQTFNYQATALSRGLDITTSVGTFVWQSVNTDVATLDVATTAAPIAGLLTGQAKVTAHTPGIYVSGCQHQQRDQSTTGFQYLRRAVDRARSYRQRHQHRQRNPGHRKSDDCDRNRHPGQHHHRLALDVEFVQSGDGGGDFYRRRDDFAGRGRDCDCFLHSSYLQHRIEAAAADLSRERG